MTVFLRTRMDTDLLHANFYLGALFFALIILLVDGFPELTMTIARLTVFYKQNDLCFYPAWAYAIPATILKIPLSLLESVIWTCLTYYVIGFSPEAGRSVLHVNILYFNCCCCSFNYRFVGYISPSPIGFHQQLTLYQFQLSSNDLSKFQEFLCRNCVTFRFFRQLLLLFAVHMTSISMFRFLASVCRTIVASTAAGSLSILFVFLFSGFIIPRRKGSYFFVHFFILCSCEGE